MIIITRDFLGVEVGQQEKSGYFNATKLAHVYFAATKKRRDVSEWLSNKRTKESIQHLSSVTGIPATDLVVVIQGGTPQEQGTWLHPKLSVRFAIWLSDEIGYQIEEWLDEWSKRQYQETPMGQPYWYRRMMLYREKTKIPVGYFSIFEEIISLIGDLEANGYVIPTGCIPDISVGKCWSNYLQNVEKINPKNVGKKYKHYYPDWAYPIDAFIYPLDLLPKFRIWMEKMYKPLKMVEYFRKKDPSALPSVCKLLGLPEGK